MIAAPSRPVIRPHAGPQEQFLSTRADICFYGGAAGAGKSFGLILHPLRHVHIPGFTAEIFRKTTGQVRNPGSIWDEARELYATASHQYAMASAMNAVRHHDGRVASGGMDSSRSLRPSWRGDWSSGNFGGGWGRVLDGRQALV